MSPFRSQLSIVRLAAIALLASTRTGAGAAGQLEGPDRAQVVFNRDIRPLLSENCFKCHGPDARARQAGLRFDRREGALALLEGGGAAIVPGKRGMSRMMIRVADERASHRMPPPEENKRLTTQQVELLGRWIDQGAAWQEHWAFIAPQRPPVPAVRNSSWIRDPIDAFILSRLERAGLDPSPEADKQALIRRVSFDLTGLPPELGEIDAFVSDESPRAYEKVVDRLLASAHYGERMAGDWLDLARYADTYGYQNDRERSVWPYRDWVIRAFNDNLSYDRFITWQLAGDLLEEPTRDQRLATAFNRLHRQTNEGGSVEEEYRVEYVADRAQTFGTAMLGLTTECARCHDHKYDPISQVEYYRLFAFFNSIDESGLYSHFTDAVPTPTLRLTTPEQEVRIGELESQVAQAEQELAAAALSRRAAFEQWLSGPAPDPVMSDMIGDYSFDSLAENQAVNRAERAKPGKALDNPQLVDGVRGKAVKLNGENNVHFPGVGEFTRVDPFSVSLWIRIPEFKDRAVIFHRSRAWTDAASQGYQLLIEDGRLSASLIHFWPGNAIRVRTAAAAPIGRWVHVVVTYDGSSRAAGLTIYVDGEPAAVETVRDNLTKGITGGGALVFTVGQRFRDRGFKSGLVDELKVFGRCITPLEAAQLHDGRSLLDAVAKADHNAGALLAYYLSNHDARFREQLDNLRDSRRQLAKALDAVEEIMTMAELPSPRPAYLLERGAYDARRQQVQPGTPAAIMPFSSELPPNRLGLARWLSDPRHPLTARVAVNRFWQILFGRGIVVTSENFGSQGALPTHPELLDYLAREFVESGWDVKTMLHRLVSSATYRQSSRAGPQARKRDPDNTLLSRSPSRRLSAEMIRDQALAVSGLLVRRIGGPSVKPYQPPGLWQEKSGVVYKPDTGEGLHRRSLYTFWKRTSPPPSMMIFDAAKRDVCVARRQVTNTPLQALVLLNDPQFVEAARALAERVLAEGGRAEDDRITFAFRLLTGRRPTRPELSTLRRLQADLLAMSARRAVRPDDENTPGSPELAACTLICSTLMSYDAAVTIR